MQVGDKVQVYESLLGGGSWRGGWYCEGFEPDGVVLIDRRDMAGIPVIVRVPRELVREPQPA